MPQDNDTLWSTCPCETCQSWNREDNGFELYTGPTGDIDGPDDEPGLICSDLAPDPDAYVSSAMYAVKGTSRTGDSSGLVATGQLDRPDCGCPVFRLRSGAVVIHVIGCTDAERVAAGDWYQPLSGSLVASGQLDRPDPALDLAAFASLISAARSGYEK